MIPLKLLISPATETEAQQAILGGADIIDVKNPKEGALGANYPWVIKRIREITPKTLQVSCTLGEIPNLPGSISLAALGAASLGVDFIKVGLGGLSAKEAEILLQNVRKAAKEYNPKIQIVATGYADARRIGAINPLFVPEIAKTAQADVAMLDTATKDGKTLFDHLTSDELRQFVDCSHSFGLKAALAGSLRKQDLPEVYRLGADIVGLRGAACTDSNRVAGTIKQERVKELVAILRQAEAQAKRA